MKSIQIAGVLLLLAASTAQAKISFTYLHNDALGSPVVATDENGAKLWEQAYKPYGQRYQIGDTNPTPKSYTGHVEDMESGLTYMQARYYNPVLGRFMAVDSVGFGRGGVHQFNRYAYGNNNPYKYVDPDGELAIPYIIGGVIATITGYVLYETLPEDTKKGLAKGIYKVIRCGKNNPGCLLNVRDESSEGADTSEGVDVSDDKKGKKPKDSSKNEPHGDGGRAKSKADKQIADLEEQLKNS